MRILVIEDDGELAELIVMGLRNAAYATDHAPTCAAATELLASTLYDVACIDLGLPDGDGLDLIRSLGPGTAMARPDRIIVLTARDSVRQRVDGLDAGADDYLVKPFAFDELLARVRAVSRRRHQHDQLLEHGGIVLDTAALTVTRHGTAVELTPRELSLLRHLLRHRGEVVSAEHLLEHVWDRNVDPFTTSVRVLMSRLRRKLGEPAVIHTVTGAGYRLGPPAEPGR